MMLPLALLAASLAAAAPTFALEGAAPPAAGADALKDRLLAAYRFDVALARLPERAGPWTVHVLIRDLNGPLASTSRADRLQVDPRALAGEASNGVFAHELSHLLDLQLLGAHALEVPRYLHEGKALETGFLYRSPGGALTGDDRARAMLFVRMSAARARKLMANFRTGPDLARVRAEHALGRSMAVGLYFVEFLRTRWRSGLQARTVPALSATFAAIGSGTSPARAFQANLGATLPELEEAFLSFLQETEGDPRARVKGTIFASILRPPEDESGMSEADPRATPASK